MAVAVSQTWKPPAVVDPNELGNTPAVCKKCYIHPAVIAAYLAGALKPTGRHKKAA